MAARFPEDPPGRSGRAAGAIVAVAVFLGCLHRMSPASAAIAAEVGSLGELEGHLSLTSDFPPASELFSCLQHGSLLKAGRSSQAPLVQAYILNTTNATEFAAASEVQPVKVLRDTRRQQWYKYPRREGMQPMLPSMKMDQWCLLVTALIFFIGLHFYLRWQPELAAQHMRILMILLAAGAIYCCLIFLISGPALGEMWIDGFTMQFFFALDTIFVFHAIVRSFHLDAKAIDSMLFVVILCQNTWEFIFYIGLAKALHSLEFLQYVLGASLLYGAYILGSEDATEGSPDKEEMFLLRFCRAQFGDRCGLCWLPLTVMIATAFVMDIDVTLTKIDTLDDGYIAFSSSVLANFTLPQMYFLAEDLFHRFWVLKYGVCAVLCFVAGQLLLHRVVAVSPFLEILVIVSIVCGSVALAVYFPKGGPCAPETPREQQPVAAA